MNNIIQFSFTSKEQLARHYIKYFKNGGLFINGNTDYHINDPVFLVVQIPGEEALAINGNVAWCNKESRLNYNGIGIHFLYDKSGKDARIKIEALIANISIDETFTI